MDFLLISCLMSYYIFFLHRFLNIMLVELNMITILIAF